MLQRHETAAISERLLPKAAAQDLREEVFEEGAFSLRIVMPRAADELLDERAFERDEFMPYWADLWPSARGLAQRVLAHPPDRAARIVELGCGLALPSIVLRLLGRNVLATDWSAEALEFARLNAERNAAGGLRIARYDWRDQPPRGRPFDLAIGADLLYERRNIDLLLGALPRLLAPHGRLLLADPGRMHLAAFIPAAERAGWRVTEVGRTTVAQPGNSPAAIVTVRIFDIARPGDHPAPVR